MKAVRYLLTGGVLACAAVLVGAQAAFAKTWDVPTSTDAGHAEFSLTEVGGVSDDPPVGSVRACDDDEDGAGVVAFVLEGDRDVLLARAAESRGGDGTCGPPQEVATTDQDSFRVRVCQHDKSRDGGFGNSRDPDSAFADVLTECESETFG